MSAADQHGEIESFVSEELPKDRTPPSPFSITMRDVKTREGVTQTFLRKPKDEVSFGRLLDVLEGPGAEVISGVLELVCVEENSAPDDDDDKRSEYERLDDFLTDPDLVIDQRTLTAMVNKISEHYADFPTEQSSGSRSTRRAAQRGSGRRR